VVLRNTAPKDAGASSADAWNQLEKINMPVTVSWGDLDVPFLVDRSEQLAARLPAGHGHPLPGTAHLPYLERPDLVAQVIADAIARS